MAARVVVVPKDQFKNLRAGRKDELVERSRILSLAHLWTAISLLLAGRWTGLLANADAQSAAGPRRRPEHVLRLVNGTRVDHGVRFSNVFRQWDLATPLRSRRWEGRSREKKMGLGWLCPVSDRHRDGSRAGCRRPGVRVVHLYPPLLGSSWYYLGLALVIIGSYFWDRIDARKISAPGNEKTRANRFHLPCLPSPHAPSVGMDCTWGGQRGPLPNPACDVRMAPTLSTPDSPGRCFCDVARDCLFPGLIPEPLLRTRV